MYEKPGGIWRCKCCGYDNDADLTACAYCGEPCHTDALAYDDLPLPDEDEEEM